MMINWKKLLVFAGVIFGGQLVGNWLVSMIGLGQGNLFGQFIAFIVPVTIVFVLWERWGNRVKL